MTMTTAEEPSAALQQAEKLVLQPSDSTESTTDTAIAKTPSNNSNNNNKTPPRTSYATDNLHSTPILSIKRQRNISASASSNSKSSSSTSKRNLLQNGKNSNNNKTPNNSNNSSTRSLTAETQLSPMHDVKPVTVRESTAVTTTTTATTTATTAVDEKIEGIFSPVYHFLDKQHAEHQHSDHESEDDDDDVSMASPEHPEDADEFNPWQFIASLPDYATVQAEVPRVSLPPLGCDDDEKKKTVVLDLDETLVHCSVEKPDTPADFTFEVNFHGILYTVHVKLRPHLKGFLRDVAKHFEVVVFTASQKVYADSLLDLIDPEKKYIHHRLFRESCLAVEGNFLKDLNVLGRDLSQTVLVDNSPHAFGYQLSNGIPIESWFDDVHDTELLKLEKFLRKRVLPAADVRVPVAAKFKLQQLVDSAPPLPTGY